MKWLAENVSRDIMVNIMEQYFPRAYVGKERRTRKSEAVAVKVGGSCSDDDDSARASRIRYEEINRPVDLREVATVRKAAEEAGLWRFIEPAKHGGFNM
jgi:putative pyruvate formate lyase activating enzyme